MIKGLISLFTSGIIFNPLVLLGIISGFWCITNKEPSEIRELFTQNWLYATVGIIAIAYTFIFARIYKETSMNIDVKATFGLAVWNFVKYFISFVLAMSFAMMISIF